MENQRYMREGIDLKRVFLLLKDRLWIFAAAAIAGAVLGAGIYLLASLVFAPEREYQSVSKVYLNFSCEPEDFNELSYNGYTWNDLMVTDPILNFTMESLPSEVSREAVIEATKAEILSDIRLLTVTITTPQPELTAKIMEATQASLVHLGKADELFESIEIYSTEGPAQIVWDNRTVSAAVSGAVLALFVCIVAVGFWYIMDDSVYVGSDVEKRYGMPAIGVFTASEPGSFQSYSNEIFANYTYLCRGNNKIALVSIDCGGDAEKAQQMLNKVLSMEKPVGEYINIPMAMPEDVPEVYEEIRKTDGAVLVVRFGSKNGKRIERALSNLQKQDCRVFGILLVEGNEKFLKNYFKGIGRKKKKV